MEGNSGEGSIFDNEHDCQQPAANAPCPLLETAADHASSGEASQQLEPPAETQLLSLLKDLGLEQHYEEKLSLSTLLQIDEMTITDEPARSHSSLPWHLLKKLMMLNATARNVTCESTIDAVVENTMLNVDVLLETQQAGDTLNPLDIITALFLCSDCFVQQELALKMSLCQFSLPLLLPNCDTKQCTLMLWAMRNIVKKYRPPSLLQSKGFIEERIVLFKLPMISFVRLGRCSLSKSEVLNKFLNRSHDTFVHRNMECGNSPRKISDGLAEITWYLPCGNNNMDVFSEPVAVANLRGDIATFETQFSFLCQTSAAIFVFFDTLNPECNVLTNKHHKAQIFLVGNNQNGFSSDALKKVATKLGLTNNNIIIKSSQKNDADFVRELQKTVRKVVEGIDGDKMMGIEQMVDVAREFGIWVDEDSSECQSARKKADDITGNIQDILSYKEEQLPLQGQTWKELTCLEKEEFRLRKVGSQNIEKYKNNLKIQKQELRERRRSQNTSDTMASFISAISSPEIERRYFLKWMQMNLDNVSRQKRSDLRKHRDKSKDSENKEEIRDVDRQLSNSSLGTEHFFREMGQIYEASVSLPETDASHQQVQHLPKLCAQLLLDGFPLELVDGEASNIPLRWVSDILSRLNDLSPQKKILVVTVLGVQGTGKSTLLNTMFGVQFAVSSGRCTRGAFMLLIKIKEDAKKVLNSDFMVIIDTEGLKSPECTGYSYEHDNELATLVVGLSDITIINVAMENTTEMKDILQIVVHAFLRMKEMGKKPKCHFVHQNVSDVSANDNNFRDTVLLLQQLNAATQAAAKMEKKEGNKSFTDVMDYSPDTGNTYIPGLWNGNPTMASVSVGYSEAVYELKKKIIHNLGSRESSANDFSDFSEWITSLWTSVKHENFIFSFRNSLVADAYMRLCTEFNKWQWEIKTKMYTWVTNAETQILHSGTLRSRKNASHVAHLTQLKQDAHKVVCERGTHLLNNLEQYFRQTEGDVYLVEGHKEEFSNSAKRLQTELLSSIVNQLTAAADIRQGMVEIERIKENHTKELEGRVCALIEECQKKKVDMTDIELDKEFDKMWNKVVNELSFSGLKATDVIGSVGHYLRDNLCHKGSHVCELLGQRKLQECGNQPFKYTADGIGEVKNIFRINEHVAAFQNLAETIIRDCTRLVTDKEEKKSNYHDTYIQEILHKIDAKLQNHQDVTNEFEVSLKQHVCANAARRFLKMHQVFTNVNNPRRCLNQKKEQFRADFKDLFHERDQCQKKAEEFTNHCLTPAVEDFVNRHLGQDVIHEMLTKRQFSTRMFFQHSVLLDLIRKQDFKNYQDYICNYVPYAQQYVLRQIVEHFSDQAVMFKVEDRCLQPCIDGINDAIEKAKTRTDGNMKTFVEDVCETLDTLRIPQDALGAFMILNNADQKQFARSLSERVKDMAEGLREKFKKTSVDAKLADLQVKPQDELYASVIGCGEQCPFCRAPCEAGGEAHHQHFTSVHRPLGLGGFKWARTEKLQINNCSCFVDSAMTFCCNATKGKWHPYKGYREIFPNWDIASDVSLQAPDYWNYALIKFNDEFAEVFKAEPADVPSAWKDITPEQAEESLRKAFHIKERDSTDILS